MQTDQFWGAHAAGVLHSAAGRMFLIIRRDERWLRFHLTLRCVYE
jgi:hypothetical protein